MFAHWIRSLTTVIIKGINSLFSPMGIKGRGYRTVGKMVVVVNIIGEKLNLDCFSPAGIFKKQKLFLNFKICFNLVAD